jgi:hypothetical protein
MQENLPPEMMSGNSHLSPNPIVKFLRNSTKKRIDLPDYPMIATDTRMISFFFRESVANRVSNIGI